MGRWVSRTYISVMDRAPHSKTAASLAAATASVARAVQWQSLVGTPVGCATSHHDARLCYSAILGQGIPERSSTATHTARAHNGTQYTAMNILNCAWFAPGRHAKLFFCNYFEPNFKSSVFTANSIRRLIIYTLLV